jgi:selenium metabolism protein YedF
MQQATQVLTLVDDETSLTNVSRMAQKAGWEVNVVSVGDEFHIELSKAAGMPRPEPIAVGKAEALSGPLVLVVSADVMGRGPSDLGDVLVRGFFHTLSEVTPLPKIIIFLNTGVKLACEGSQVLDDLRALETEGIEIMVCGTCLGFFELTDAVAVGHVSNMYDIAETMLKASKVVNL